MLYEYCCLASLRGPLACGLALARPVSYSTCCGACITLHSRLPLPRAPTFDIFIHAPRPISGNRVLRLSGGHRPMQGQHSRRLPLHRGLLHRVHTHGVYPSIEASSIVFEGRPLARVASSTSAISSNSTCGSTRARCASTVATGTAMAVLHKW